MQGRSLVVMGLVVGCAACPNEGGSAGAAASATAATAAPRPAASAAASTTAAAAPSATASAAAEDPCRKHALTQGGSGTKADPCKYEPDLLIAESGKLEEQGAQFTVTNPWDEEVNRLSAAVYYYDKEGKQLGIKVGGKDARAARLDAEPVKIPGGRKPTAVMLGPAKKDLPAEVDTVELQILGFGWDNGENNTAYFVSTTPFRQNRAIHGGDGPTGIEACDGYRALLESCPSMMPDALKAMRKSLRDYNNAAPEIQKKLAEGLEKGCIAGTTAAKGKCKPE
jgi:hypothetical protein